MSTHTTITTPITHQRALCNLCGAVRLVHRNYFGPEYHGEPGFNGEPRMMKTVKCAGACQVRTPHAVIRDHDPRANALETMRPDEHGALVF